MKLKTYTPLASLAIAAMCAGSASAATYTYSGNNINIGNDLTGPTPGVPDGKLDLWVGNPDIPVAGDNNIWVTGGNGKNARIDSATPWLGGTIEHTNKDFFAWSNASVVDFHLNGANARIGNRTGQARTLTGNTLTLTAGNTYLNSQSLTLDFNNYVGTNGLLITGINGKVTEFAAFNSSNANGFDGLSGTIELNHINGAGAQLRFGQDIANATFGILLSDSMASAATINVISNRYRTGNNVSVTDFSIEDWTFGDHDNDINTADEDYLAFGYDFAAGTYSLDATAIGNGATDLAGLGLSAYFIDGGGTFTVAAVPEPSSTALLGLGGLALIFRRRK